MISIPHDATGVANQCPACAADKHSNGRTSHIPSPALVRVSEAVCGDLDPVESIIACSEQIETRGGPGPGAAVEGADIEAAISLGKERRVVREHMPEVVLIAVFEAII